MLTTLKMATAILACLLGSPPALAAEVTTPPLAGQPCPEFTLDEITHFGKTRASLADFSGSWLIPDF